MPGYSVLFPPLAALLGAAARRARWRRSPPRGSSSAWSRDTRRRARRRRCGSRSATATRSSRGRLTFALGRRLGLGAVLAARARAARRGPASLAALASARQPGRRRLRGAGGRRLVAGPPRAGGRCALARPAPLRAGASRWPSPSRRAAASRSRRSSFWPALAATVAVGLVAARATRACCASASRSTPLALVASFALATPMGGNAVRLGALFAGPVAALRCCGARSRRALAAARAAAAVLAVGRAGRRLGARRAATPSVHAALLRRAARLPGARRRRRARSASRSRSPTTTGRRAGSRRTSPLARGWERQLDRERNALFYDGRPLTRGALPPLARRQRGPLRRARRRADRLLGGAPRPQLVRDGPPVPARGLARRALARSSRSPARAPLAARRRRA